MAIKSLSHDEQIVVLARIVHKLTICARKACDLDSGNVTEPQVLRSYNDLLNNVTRTLLHYTSGSDGCSLESVIEMIQMFGSQNNRVEEINWVLGLEKAKAQEASSSR